MLKNGHLRRRKKKTTCLSKGFEKKGSKITFYRVILSKSGFFTQIRISRGILEKSENFTKFLPFLKRQNFSQTFEVQEKKSQTSEVQEKWTLTVSFYEQKSCSLFLNFRRLRFFFIFELQFFFLRKIVKTSKFKKFCLNFSEVFPKFWLKKQLKIGVQTV